MKSFVVEGSDTQLTNDLNNYPDLQDSQLIIQYEYFDLEHMDPLFFVGSEEFERPPGGYLPNLRSARISYLDGAATK